jgi:hypothetical protein
MVGEEIPFTTPPITVTTGSKSALVIGIIIRRVKLPINTVDSVAINGTESNNIIVFP